MSNEPLPLEAGLALPEPLPPLEPARLYTYAEAAPYFGSWAKERMVRRWVEHGKIAYTPLPGGRGRGLTGQQILDYFEANRETRVGA